MASYKTKQRKFLHIGQFIGVDLESSPAAVALSRSPDAPNMIRDVRGKVRKRMGFYKTQDYGERINAIYTLKTPQLDITLVHAGTKLYDMADDREVFSGMQNCRSAGFQLGGALYIVDGAKLRVFDGQAITAVEDAAYIPTITISRSPSGGGTAYEGLNLLTGSFRESFLSDGAARDYQLSFGNLTSAAEVTAKRMTALGVWTDYANGVDFTVDTATGIVSFAAAVPPPVVVGMDNLVITASKDGTSSRQKINSCTVGIVYGVNGASDRLFLSGNPTLPQSDWYSELRDGSYFPEGNYCELGQSSCSVVGYSIVDNRLAAHKARDDDGRNIVLREGTTDGGAAFPIVNTLYGSGAVSKNGFVVVDSESLFIAEDGVYALTKQDVTGTRYTQNRSYYINRALCAEQELPNASAAFFDRFVAVAVGGKLYLLDTVSKDYQKNAPYSEFQYECFVCTGIDASCLFTAGGALCFGTPKGELMRFYSDPESPASYNDCGEPVRAYWTTPDLSGDSFYTRKAFKLLSMKLHSASATSVSVSVLRNGLWEELHSGDTGARFFSFSRVIFSKHTFSTDTTPRTLVRRLSLRREPSTRIKFENGEADEPFGLCEIGIEYETLNKYKE